MNEMIIRSAGGAIERFAVSEDKTRLRIEGYASTPEPDIDGYRFLPEAFSESIPSYMRYGSILHNHDRDRLIGRATKVEPHAGKGLWFEGEIDMGDPFSAQVGGQILRGVLRSFSIGVRRQVDETQKDGTTIFRKVWLMEVSLVSVPANAGAGLSAAYVGGADQEAVLTRMADDLRKRVIDDIDGHVRAVEETIAQMIEEAKRTLGAERGGLELAAARAFEDRVGTVRSLLAASLKDEDGGEIGRVLGEFMRLGETERINPVVEDDPSPGGGASGGRATPPAVAYTPTGDAGAGPSGGAGGKAGSRPLEGSLVPEFTPPDGADKHRHRIGVLREDGTGQTEITRSESFIAHAHPISNWVVVPVDVAGRRSDHPGSLFPGEQLSADDPDVVRLQAAAEELGYKLERATLVRIGAPELDDLGIGAFRELTFEFADD